MYIYQMYFSYCTYDLLHVGQCTIYKRRDTIYECVWRRYLYDYYILRKEGVGTESSLVEVICVTP